MTATATSVNAKRTSGSTTWRRKVNARRSRNLDQKTRHTDCSNIARWYRSGWGRYTQGDRLGLHLYSYVADNPLLWIDPLGLLRWRYYQQFGTLSDPVVRNGCTQVRFRMGHTCKQIGCRYPSRTPVYKLEFEAEADFFILISDIINKKAQAAVRAHEEEHVDTFINNVLGGLSAVLPYERKDYSSAADCEAAALRAVSDIRLNGEKGQAAVDDYVGYAVGKLFGGQCY